MEKIKIKGMTCQHCVMAVTKALNNISGLRNVRVDLEKGEATYNNMANVPRQVIRQAIEKAGYQAGE